MKLSIKRVASVDPRKLAEALRHEAQYSLDKLRWREPQEVCCAAALLAVLDWVQSAVDEETYCDAYRSVGNYARSAEVGRKAIRATARAWLEAGGTLEVT